MTFKTPPYGLEDKVCYFGKKINSEDCVKNHEEISKLIAVKYNHRGPEIITAIKKMENPKITMLEIREDVASRGRDVNM